MSGRLWTALAALACLAAPAQAASPLGVGGKASPLPAWVELCERHPDHCAVNTSEPESVPLTAATRALIEAVNSEVNRAVSAVIDAEHWGIADRWDLPSDGRGDCEDYQLLKRKLLVEAGLPRRALRMTVVIDTLGQGHAVLMVRTEQGDLILDNLTDLVLGWSETGYQFVKRESQNRIGWVRLEAGIQKTLTATAR